MSACVCLQVQLIGELKGSKSRSVNSTSGYDNHGYQNLSLYQLFLMERVDWSGGDQNYLLTSGHSHLSERGGRDCLYSEADSANCSNCFHAVSRLVKEVERKAEHFDAFVADHFDCEDIWDRRFSPNSTCKSCKVSCLYFLFICKISVVYP